MKRFNLIILTVVMSLLCISCATTTTKAKEMPSGVLFVNLPESSYEWQVLTSDRSIKVHNSDIEGIGNFRVYEIQSTRNGIFRVVFNYKNIETDEVEYSLAYNIELNKGIMRVLNAKDSSIKNTPLEIIGNKTEGN